MTTDCFELWTHAVNVQPEHMDASLEMEIRRASWGTQIKQKKGTTNWFHFAIPTPTIIDDCEVEIRRVMLRGNITNNARIICYDIVEAGYPKNHHLGGTPKEVNIIGREINGTDWGDFDVSNKICRGPIILSVQVEFMNDSHDDPPVRFLCAGAHFEEV